MGKRTKKKLNNNWGLQNKSEILIIKYDFEKSNLIININLVILVYGQNTIFLKHQKKMSFKAQNGNFARPNTHESGW